MEPLLVGVGPEPMVHHHEHSRACLSYTIKICWMGRGFALLSIVCKSNLSINFIFLIIRIFRFSDICLPAPAPFRVKKAVFWGLITGIPKEPIF
jgi:hypothetical protein